VTSGRSDGSESDEEDYNLKFVEFNHDDYKEVTRAYMSGEKLINIHATGVLLDCFISILEELSQDLSQISNCGKMIAFRLVRKFAVDMLQMDSAELMLYAAFRSPVDDIFY
jgi:hypothetical protein